VSKTTAIDELIKVMNQLLGPGGCPWDREQTHQSLIKYLIEETYEVIEAINQGDMHKLKEELGDLLLQVVFHVYPPHYREVNYTIKKQPYFRPLFYFATIIAPFVWLEIRLLFQPILPPCLPS
jgi:hypothetical protein